MIYIEDVTLYVYLIFYSIQEKDVTFFFGVFTSLRTQVTRHACLVTKTRGLVRGTFH